MFGMKRRKKGPFNNIIHKCLYWKNKTTYT